MKAFKKICVLSLLLCALILFLHAAFKEESEEVLSRLPAITETVREKAEELKTIILEFLQEKKQEASSGQGGEKTLVDDRKADSSKASDETESVSYTWESYDGHLKLSFEYTNFPVGQYEYYRSLSRYYDPADYHHYLEDPVSVRLAEAIAEQMRKLGKSQKLSEYDIVMNTICFVQNMSYETDLDANGLEEYPKYPIETLYEKKGDCEDTCILLAALLRALGYKTVLLVYEDHMAVGVAGNDLAGSYYEVDGTNYYYVETTSTGWKIGEVPDVYKGVACEVY